LAGFPENRVYNFRHWLAGCRETDESNESIHLELLTPTYVYDLLSRGSMMAKLEQHAM
jgi:hypothetical protein